ncbi:MAG: sodium:proton antiporter [Gammaproteobacteria bacterium]|nr:sodium:proton antiporter [Gammaproteobacteria bacterium]
MSSLLLLGLIGLLGFACQWLAAWVRLPAILFLLLTGILLGPVTGTLDPDALFGDLLFPYISLSVAVILFEGALTLRRNQLSSIGRPVRNMVTIGVVINGLIVAVATHYLVGLSWLLSFLFGAIMVVTGPTVIMPMLKTVRPNPRIADVLRWEGIVIDPIGALIAVLFFEWIVVQQSTSGFGTVFYVFGATVLTGLLIGLILGYLFGLLLRNHHIPEALHNFASLSLVCFAYALSDTITHESGLLAVTVMGMLLANMRDVHVHSILDFKEDLTVVFISGLFIVLAARLDFAALSAIGLSAFAVLLVMQFIARPLKVAASFIGSDFSWRERAMVAWIGPRGIVAAAVSAVFALRLQELGFEGAESIVPLAFMIIIGTVVLQSLTARSVAKLLDVAQPETHGVLIVGANPFSIQIAEALKKENVESLICDTNWDSLSAARLAGLNTYYGNPSSDHAGYHLDIAPYGSLLGLSNHHEYNVTQAARFRGEFGGNQVYVLAPNQSPDRLHKHIASAQNSGRILFGTEHTYLSFKKLLNDGAGIRITEVNENYSFARWREDNPGAIALFCIEPDGDMEFETINTPLDPADGSKLFYVSPANNEEAA